MIISLVKGRIEYPAKGLPALFTTADSFLVTNLGPLLHWTFLAVLIIILSEQLLSFNLLFERLLAHLHQAYLLLQHL